MTIEKAPLEWFSQHAIDLSSDTATPVIVVVSYFPGWSAIVDGVQRESGRVGGALPGVIV